MSLLARTPRTRRDVASKAPCARGPWTSTSASARSRPTSSVLLRRRRGRGEAADHVLLYGPPGLGQDDPRHDHRPRARGQRPLHRRAGGRAGGGPRRHPDVARRAGRPVHRRDPSPEPRGRGDPLPGDGGLRAGRDDRQGARRRGSLRLSLKPFTVVGATTRAGRISGPLRDRFGATYRLDFYAERRADGDRRAVGRDPRRGDRPATPRADRPARSRDAADREPAAQARPRPRRGPRRRTRRRAGRADGDARSWRSTTRASTRRTASCWRRSSRSSARARSASQALAAVLAEEIETIEDVYEPFLLRLGFLDRTPQGRIATEAARAHLAGLGLRDPAAAPRRAGHAVRLWDDMTLAPEARRDVPPAVGAASSVRGRSRRRPRTGPRARGSGRLTLPHGVVETPQFMPVGTNATVKALDPDDLDDGRRVDHPVANTYHLYLRPGPRADRAARRAAPVHGLGPADPHGLGRLPGRLARATCGSSTTTGRRSGATSTGPPTGSRRSTAIAVQEALGPDIAVAFDQPVFPTLAARRSSRTRCDRTHRWAERSLGGAHADGPGAVRDRPGRPGPGAARRRRRGSSPPAVRRHLHRGPGRRRDARPAGRRRWTSWCRSSTDDPRPRYLMGLGSPVDLLEAVHRGVDLFDSVLPARVARNGQLWVPGRPPEHPQPARSWTTRSRSRRAARASLCRRFSRAYLAHLFRAQELLAYRLATCHNLTFTLDFMARIRAALRAGTFPVGTARTAPCAPVRMSGGEAAVKSA